MMDIDIQRRMDTAYQFFLEKYNKEKARLMALPERAFRELVNDVNSGGVIKVPKGGRQYQVDSLLKIEFPSR